MNKLEQITLEEKQDEQFKIEDLDTANWAFRKLAAIKSKQEEINRLARNEIERITDWQDKEIGNLDDSQEYFEHLLKKFYEEEKERDPRFKLSTPYGKLTSRKGTKKWNTPNKDMVIEQLENRGFDHLVRHKKEINLQDMKKEFQIVGDQVVDSNGEIVEGAYITENPTSYSIKPNV